MANVITTKHNVIVPNDDRWDMCGHLTVGDKASFVFCEDDSFGPVGRYACCKECGEAQEKTATEDCHDCGGEFPLTEMYRFWGFDWNISQGDEPLYICECCRGKEKHQTRIAEDKANYEREMDYFPEDYEEVEFDSLDEVDIDYDEDATEWVHEVSSNLEDESGLFIDPRE